MSRRNLTGSLFHGREQQPRILDVSKSIKKSIYSEADEQAMFFAILRRSAPRPPIQRRKITRGKFKGGWIEEEDVLDQAFLSHPLYILTRVRHFPNEGKRNPGFAVSQGIRAGAFDIFLDLAKFGYHGWRGEFKTLEGEISDEQKAERIWLDKQGYFAHYYFSHVEALIMLAYYCEIDTKRLNGFPRSLREAKGYNPEIGHDALCGCHYKISKLYKF